MTHSTKSRLDVDSVEGTMPQVTRVSTFRYNERPNILWVEIEDSDGATGLGETFSLSETVSSYIHEGVAPYLLGQSPGSIARHWLSMYRQRGRSGVGTEARGASAVDIALWDLLGRRVGLPLYQLLGGSMRERIPVYNTCGGPNYVREAAVPGRLYTGASVADKFDDLHMTKEAPEELARSLLEMGISAMKIWPLDELALETGGIGIRVADLDHALEPIRRIRDAVGSDMEVALELHGKWSLRPALQIVAAVNELDLLWVEDPIPLDSLRALEEVCQASRSPVLVGETVGGRFAYREILERTSVAIIMSDPGWAGGLTEMRRIADLTSSFQRAFTTHDATGPVSMAVGAHAAMYAETTIFQEIVRAFLFGWYEEACQGLPIVSDGHVTLSDRPGHGVALRAEILDRLIRRDST